MARLAYLPANAPSIRANRIASAARRFPPPWTVEELDACFVVKDSGGQQLAYVYYGNWCVSPFSRYKYPEMKGEQRPTVRQ